MAQLPPNSPDPMSYQPQPAGVLVDQDQSHLNTLAIFYFIYAALDALAAAILSVVVAFIVFGGLFGAASAQRPGDAGAVFGVFLFFACLWALLPILFTVLAVLNYKAGRALRARKSLTLCYVMAVIACLNFPLGTILGIFTFIVLGRPSVKASFR